MSKTVIKVKMIKKILKLFLVDELSQKHISECLDVPRSTVRDYIKRTKQVSLTWPMIQALSDEALANKLFPKKQKKIHPDWHEVQSELNKKGVTLQLLWEEYSAVTEHYYSYSQFCRRYNHWRKQNRLWLPHDHIPGESLYIDYSGLTLAYYDRQLQTLCSAEIFVATLGASNLIFCEATPSQSLVYWIGSHVRAFEYIGGLPLLLVPDNLRSGVTKAHRYDPVINASYEAMAQYYGITILPTRVRSPKDKAKVENAVQQVERRILAKLRSTDFFSVDEINQAMTPLLQELNQRTMKQYQASRQELFDKIDKPALKPLNVSPYEFAQWQDLRINGGYHVQVNQHFYSVSHTFIGKMVQVRIDERHVEIFYTQKRIALHQRDDTPNKHTTITEHRPPAHQKYLECNTEYLLNASQHIGEHTHRFMKQLLECAEQHSKRLIRRGLGILRLEKYYGAQRLEEALSRLSDFHFATLHDVEMMLKNGLDDKSLEDISRKNNLSQDHEFIRGADYYNHNEEES